MDLFIFRILFVLSRFGLICEVVQEAQRPEFISNCAPYEDESCKLDCHVYACSELNCGYEQNHYEQECEQTLNIISYYYAWFSDPSIDFILSMTILPPEDISGLKRIYFEVKDPEPAVFMAVFSALENDLKRLFQDEVVIEFPVAGVELGDSITIGISSNVCPKQKEISLAMRPYPRPEQDLTTENARCPEMYLDATSGILVSTLPESPDGAVINIDVPSDWEDARETTEGVEKDKEGAVNVKQKLAVYAALLIFILVVCIFCLVRVIENLRNSDTGMYTKRGYRIVNPETVTETAFTDSGTDTEN